MGPMPRKLSTDVSMLEVISPQYAGPIWTWVFLNVRIVGSGVTWLECATSKGLNV